ncbi:MAG: hypothetical protein DLM57_06910 [Pseudonocardiales bacterium]|nr:MAG: hypothetical protein DLM57_06910 [Pseudonocardiales bacterium]
MIVGLRTFRVDESGLLLPLYSNLSWYDGPNTATCAPPTGERHGHAHAVPSPDCECGFYAYGSEAAANCNRHMRYVQAVVSCWGGVIAGTQGVRAEHARIDAIWLNPNVASWMHKRVAARYPSARMYADRQLMLAQHPPSALDCYEQAAPHRAAPRAGAAGLGAALLVLGVLPSTWLRQTALLWDAWLVATLAVSALVMWLLVGARAPGHRAAAFVTAGVLAWLLAPLFGPTGWLLRLPLLRGILVAAGGYLLTLRPGFFPVERSPKERAFCGVRA